MIDAMELVFWWFMNTFSEILGTQDREKYHRRQTSPNDHSRVATTEDLDGSRLYKE